VVAAIIAPLIPAPIKVKGICWAPLFHLPIDVIPDVLLGLSFTDDMAVLYTAISMIRSHMTKPTATGRRNLWGAEI
jgi:uncharacterized membrane protein YkvA (DUF1232 family)